MSRGPWWASRRSALTWLLLAMAGCVVLFVAIYLVFVRTTRGQGVDDAALRGTVIGRRHIISPVSNILDLISVTELGVATITVGVVGVLRKRPILALLTMTLVAGSNITSELLKHVVLPRPVLDPADRLPFNTLPSGHTTVALSVAVAFTLVSPARLRWLVAIVGAAYGAATGVATMSAGWHRPSDVVAGCVVVGAWTALVGAIGVCLRPGGEREPGPGEAAYAMIITIFSVVAAVLVAVGTAALVETALTLPEASTRPRLFLAYAGGASTAAGMALAAMTGLLVVARRVGTDDLDRQPS